MRNCFRIAALAAGLAAPATGFAAEGGFTIYPLGNLAFGAGATPPEGIYITPSIYYYQGDRSGEIPIGGVISFESDVSLFVSALNMLWVPEAKVFGGNLGLSVNVPAGYIDLKGELSGLGTLKKEVDGGGFGQISAKAQLGWAVNESFSHTVAVTGFLPTGRYSPGFSASIGLNRPAVDLTWSATYFDKPTGLEFSGGIGFVFNGENDETDYTTGTEFHAEGAIGKRFDNGWVLGVAGYAYKQISDDDGAPAVLDGNKGQVFGLGPAVSYTRVVNEHVVILNARYYQEFGVENRFEGSSTFLTATVRF